MGAEKRKDVTRTTANTINRAIAVLRGFEKFVEGE